MEATGLEKGGIYRHFDSKQQLAAEAFDYAWKLVLDTRFKGTQAISNTVDRLKQIVRNFWERRAGLVPGGCPLLNTAIDSDDGNPQLRDKARRALSSWLDRLRTWGPSTAAFSATLRMLQWGWPLQALWGRTNRSPQSN
jgi:TetR/AcrR family transcriptional repressor of nem operon